MKYYLDTNTIIYSIKGTYPNIVEHFKMTPKESIVIPQIVIAEIEYGAQKSSNYEKTINKYNDFTCNFDVAYFDKNAAEAYGVIRSQLEREGKLIGPSKIRAGDRSFYYIFSQNFHLHAKFKFGIIHIYLRKERL